MYVKGVAVPSLTLYFFSFQHFGAHFVRSAITWQDPEPANLQ